MIDLDVKSLRVLIVEDNAHFRALVRTILEALDITKIAEARHGGEAMAVLADFEADVAVLDWRMETMDGVEFLRRVRDEAESPDPYLPVVMVTGYSDASLIRDARDAGVDEFLAKPISAKSLLGALVEVLTHRRAFVRSPDYFGPDRRRRELPYEGGDRRRKAPDLIEAKPRRTGEPQKA